jgi:transcriptional regulator with GAF, ATPase, and Fis domain
MSPSECWIRLHLDSVLPKDLVRRLSALGIVPHESPRSSRCPQILVCEAIDGSLCDEISRASGQASRVIVLATSRSVPADAIFPAMQAGASDVLVWHDLADPAAAIASRLRRWSEVDDACTSPAVGKRLVGESAAWRSALEQVIELALHTESPILVTGESGTGKELVAQLVHELRAREHRGPFVILDCTTVVADLSGSEFFGHERGAFTGAYTSREGAFERADGGTLFLDEVGELPQRLQAELLRVVQEGTYKRVGSNEWRKASFRLICATHRDLEADRARGAFRADLYFRLAGGTCRLPALRERREDIPLLVESFLREAFGDAAPSVDAGVLAFLVTREYPGNVRELRQLVGRIASRYAPPGPLTIGAVPRSELPATSVPSGACRDALERAVLLALARGQGVEEIRQAAAEIAYRIVLDQERGSTSQSSRRLKVSTRAVQMYLSRFNGFAAAPSDHEPLGGAATVEPVRS